MSEDKNGHAQAQPALLHQVRLLGPHANSTSCVHCGTRLTDENLKDLCPARPAEQPAPPLRKCICGHMVVCPRFELIAAPPESTVDASYNHGEPSAPPQPCPPGYVPMEVTANGITTQEFAMADMPAEPSVEARQPEIPFHHISWCKRYESQACNCGLDNAIAAAKREGMEESARLVDEKAWTLLDIGDLAASAEMKLMAAILRLPKEQQNGTR